MNSKNLLVTGLVLAAIAAVSVIAYRSASRPAATVCSICRRGLHAGVSYYLETAKGDLVACCPRCGMHHQAEHPGEVRSSRATDLATGATISAESAFYVEGGDIHYCTAAEKPVERLPQGESVRAFDRCLPTLVAFKDRAGAEAYHRQHGGRILDYQQALESVRRQ